jgi:hypothetical protein
MGTYVKLCPGCKTATALQAVRCHQCGHAYRTKFVQPDTIPSLRQRLMAE